MKAPSFLAAIAVYLAYNAIIFATWATVGANYTDLVGRTIAFERLFVPLAIGAAFLLVIVTANGWWHSAFTEVRVTKPRWPLFLITFGILGFLVTNIFGINWSALTGVHLLILIAAGVLVGFNEELVTRGILIIGARHASLSEVLVWFWSSLLFALMHLPNVFFGMPWIGGPVQCMLAFIMGGAFYVLRRLSGIIVLPMAMHGAWDFVSFSSQASAGHSSLAPYFQFGTYAFGIIGLVAVLAHQRHDNGRPAA